MARPDKASAVAELADEFRNSAGAVLTEYRGLSVKQLQDLRRVLGDNASYAVVKNTLTKIAAREAGVTAFDDLLVGPSAIAFIKGDAVEAAKGLRDFARTNSPLVIKGGVLDGKALTTDEIARIADLETREVLLAKLAGALLASLQNAVFLFNAPLAQVARLAGALQAKATDDPSILGGGSGQPADADTSAATDTTPATDSSDTSAEAATGDVEAAPVTDADDTTAVADAGDTSSAADSGDTSTVADDTTPVPEAGAEQTNEG